MAQSVLELAVQTGKWDAGLKKAQQALNNFTQSQGGLQQALQKDGDKVKQFVEMMGKTTSQAKTARGQMNEYKSTIEQLSRSYNSLSESEKKTFGQTFQRSIDQVTQKFKAAQEEAKRLNASMNGTPAPGGGALGGLKGMAGNVAGVFGISASMLTGIGAATAAFAGLKAVISDNIATAMNFEKSMSMLSSLTGKTGEDLEQLKEYAIELGSTTTLSASEVADAFRLIGSQQPQLLASSQALKEVTKNAITLSEAAGIDLATASQTLSTSINQMGGDSSNAERFINVLAAASQKGAGDIAWLGEAITKSGTTAKMVGTSYEQLVANLEQLAQAGFDASTAGTALRSIIVNLEKQSDDELKPSVVGLTEAFANLGDKHLSVAQMSQLVGKMFGAQAAVLAENAAKARELEQEITGTSTAEDQAKTNTDNLDGSLKSLSSAWEGLNLHINSSNGFLKDCVDWMTQLVQEMDSFVQSGELAKPSSQYWIDSLINIKDAAHDAFIELQKMLGVFPDDPESFAKLPASTGVSWKDNSFNFQSIMGEEGVVVTAPKGGGKSGGGGGVKKPKKSGGRTAKIDPPAPAGSVAALNKELTDLKKKQDLATDTTTWKNYQKKIDEITAKVALLKGEIDFKGKGQPGVGKEEIEIPGKVHVKETTAQDIKDQLDQFAPADPYKIDVDVNYKYRKKAEDDRLKQMSKAASMAADAVSSIGAAFASIEDPSAKAAGTVVQAIASIALGFAQATVQASSMGPWGWVAFLAAGAAAMATTISTIHSLTGYAEGGLVPGNQYSGDNIPGGAMVNAGELVLNRAQQGNLASQLQEGGGGYSPSHISGEQIYIALNRYTQRSGKGEIVTWK